MKCSHGEKMVVSKIFMCQHLECGIRVTKIDIRSTRKTRFGDIGISAGPLKVKNPFFHVDILGPPNTIIINVTDEKCLYSRLIDPKLTRKRHNPYGRRTRTQ